LEGKEPCFTRSLEHQPSSDGQIREDSNAELDPECQRDWSRADICRADTIQGLMQARWQTRIGVEGRPVSVELQEWPQHIGKAGAILERFKGVWSDRLMVLEEGVKSSRTM
jgi:hypothetical protein